MIDLISRLLGGLSESKSGSYWLLALLTLLLAAIVGTIAGLMFPSSIPLMEQVRELYTLTPPPIQFAVLIGTISICIILGAVALNQRQRQNESESVKVQLKGELESKNQELHKLKRMITRLEGELESKNQQLQELENKIARYEQESQETKQELAELRRFRDNLSMVSERETIWKRPATNPPRFIPRSHRHTIFVCMLNLKGGVGKTTLTVNLAAYLNKFLEKGILLVDLDFQGTLGNLVTNDILRNNQYMHGATLERIYEQYQYTYERHKHINPAQLIQPLLTQVEGLDNASVVLCRDTLELVEQRLYADFLSDPNNKDCRWFFRDIFHNDKCMDIILKNYDFIFFDCPPRITPSVINALACSDYVLIPTRLDSGSVDVVPRTINWLRSLGKEYPSEVLGVVVLGAMREGQLTHPNQIAYENLQDMLKKFKLPDRLFEATVPISPHAINKNRHTPYAALKLRGQEFYRPVAEEFLRRVH